MKKTAIVIASLLLFSSLFFTTSITAFAANDKNEHNENSEIFYLDDGSFYITSIQTISNTQKHQGNKGSLATYSSVTTTKSTTYYNALNVAQWKFNLTCSFTFNGTTSTCTSASSSVNIYDSSWNIESKTASKSGNKATGSVVMKTNFLGLVLKRTANLTITCDKNGNIS